MECHYQNSLYLRILISEAVSFFLFPVQSNWFVSQYEASLKTEKCHYHHTISNIHPYYHTLYQNPLDKCNNVINLIYVLKLMKWFKEVLFFKLSNVP